MPLNGVGNAIQPPLHHRGGSLVLSLMLVGLLVQPSLGCNPALTALQTRLN